MSTFQFRAKQGQVDAVCRLLTQHVGKPKVGIRNGVPTITVAVPQGISKRSIDRLLFANHVSGAVSRKNRFVVVQGESFSIMYNPHVETGKPFIWVEGGKFLGKHRRVMVDSGCGCGSCWHYELEKV